MAKTIQICQNHQERLTPLIYTFAFAGAELWCPYCGCTSGGLDLGLVVIRTDKLKSRADRDIEKAKDYLKAMSISGCSQIKWKNKWINPVDLPQEEKDRLNAIKEVWVYPIAMEKAK